jgi:hypothetical protein
MVVATLRQVTQLAIVASLAANCGTEQSGVATTGPPGGERDAGNNADAANPADAGAVSECSFTPCGGDLVGSWTIRHVCPASVSVRNCPTVELDPKDVIVTGSFSFGTDGGLTFDIMSSGTWEGLVPPSCVTGTDCKSIAESLYQVNAPPATCTSDGDGGCSCSSPATPEQMATTPYRVSGNVAANMLYCVQDGLLKLRNEAGTVFVAAR